MDTASYNHVPRKTPPGPLCLFPCKQAMYHDETVTPSSVKLVAEGRVVAAEETVRDVRTEHCKSGRVVEHVLRRRVLWSA